MKYILIMMLVSPQIVARCERVSMCDDYGMNCRITQLCDNSYDIPAANIVRPYINRTEIKPLRGLGIPPIGTTRCSQRKVNGRFRRVCD